MDELEAVGDPELRETLLWARSEALPVDADQLAAAHEIHRNVARSRLERLAAAGLLTAGFERRTGRSGPGAGRPAKVYTVAPELDAIEFPARHYESLLGLLLAGLPSEGRAEKLRAIGVEFGIELAQAARLRPAKTLATGFDRMCAAVRSLGYQAAVSEVTENGAVIATPTCPLRPLVRAHPEAADIDRGMWAGLAATALAGSEVVEVRCETSDCLEDHAACRVLIELHNRPKRRSN
jgi:predicted ArsR family transcriptional regulator